MEHDMYPPPLQGDNVYILLVFDTSLSRLEHILETLCPLGVQKFGRWTSSPMFVYIHTSPWNPDTLIRTPDLSGHLTFQDTSLIRTPDLSGHLTNQDTSLIRTPPLSGHYSVLRSSTVYSPHVSTLFRLFTFSSHSMTQTSTCWTSTLWLFVHSTQCQTPIIQYAVRCQYSLLMCVRY